MVAKPRISCTWEHPLLFFQLVLIQSLTVWTWWAPSGIGIWRSSLFSVKICRLFTNWNRTICGSGCSRCLKRDPNLTTTHHLWSLTAQMSLPIWQRLTVIRPHPKTASQTANWIMEAKNRKLRWSKVNRGILTAPEMVLSETLLLCPTHEIVVT